MFMIEMAKANSICWHNMHKDQYHMVGIIYHYLFQLGWKSLLINLNSFKLQIQPVHVTYQKNKVYHFQRDWMENISVIQSQQYHEYRFNSI